MKTYLTTSFAIFSLLLSQYSYAGPVFYSAYNYQPNLAQADQLDIKDLGFTPKEIEGDSKEQDVLKVRAKKLQTHTYFGIATLALALATAFTAPENEKADSAHMTLGIATFASYTTAAYFSLSAPQSTEEQKGWNVKIHKSLIFVHMPLMILTPLAGIKANHDYKRGEDPSGLGKYKKSFGNALVGSLLASGLVMSIDF